MQLEMRRIIQQVHDLRKDEQLRQQVKLPPEAYFLNKDEIVCFPGKNGDSRYPYAYDGLTLWAYASGNVKLQESTFTVLF